MAEPPLPIAALMLRARNAKSAKARHDLAYFGWEASVRLAVAARPPADRAGLAMPSTGDWLSALAEHDRVLEDPDVLAVHRLLSHEGLGRTATPRSSTLTRTLEGLAAYRNAILGHGAVRADEFYERAGDVLAAGLEAAWRLAAVWPEASQLICVESVELDVDGRRRGRLLALNGTAARVVDPRGTTIDDDLLPRRLYLEDRGRYHPLHPWLVFEAAELRERVLFFNGRGRFARYLDYVGGEQIKGKALSEVWPGLEGDLDVAMLPARPDEPTEARDPARFGDYRLLGKLGEGGMGVVYLARQESLGRTVALKMLPAGAAVDPVAVARFRREIAALARCEHPNVVKILAAGEIDSQRYYAMELIDGADLSEVSGALAAGSDLDQAVSTASERVRKVRDEAFAELPPVARPAASAALPARRRDRHRALAELFRDAARAVDHLHAQGILHRDIKPANLMVTAGDHRVVLMDLGLASLGDASRSLTRDKSSILGTLRYLPPEQLQRSLLSLDRRADVYSLGATFYELLVSRPFFDGDSEPRLIEQVLRETPTDPHVANPALDRDLALILRKATDKDPKRRYDDAAALAADLDAFLAGEPITARPPSLGYLLGLAIRRHRAVAATMLLAVVVAAAGATWFLMRERRLRAEAQRASEVARAAEDRAQATLAWTLLEQGRVELLDHHPARAAAHLIAAAPRLWDEPITKALVAETMRDVERGRTRFVGHARGVRRAAFTADGARVITGSLDGTVRVWDAASGATLATLRADAGSVLTAALDPTGARVVTTHEDGTARVWDATTGSQLSLFDARPGIHASSWGNEYVVASALFSPDGERVLSVVDQGAALWDPVSGATKLSVAGHPEAVMSAVFSLDGTKLATTSTDRTARIWDAASGSMLASLADHGSAVLSAAFSSDGTQLVTTTIFGVVRTWDVATGRERLTLTGHVGSVGAAAFSPDGKWVLSTGDDQTARLWRTDDGVAITTMTGKVASATFSADGARVLTTSYDGSARVWAPGGKILATLDGHTGPVTSGAFSPDGTRVITASDDGSARAWDVTDRRLLAAMRRHQDWGRTAAFDAGATRVITSGNDDVARIWDATTGAAIVTLSGHRGDVVRATFSPDGERAITHSEDGTARLWDARTGAALAMPGTGVYAAAYAPDGATLVTFGESLQIWDATTGALRATVEVGPGHTSLTAVSADRVVTASQLDASPWQPPRVWDLGTGAQIASLASPKVSVHESSFHPDGRRLLRACNDGLARIFDSSTGALLLALTGHTGAVRTAAFSADGRVAVTGSEDQTARLWDVDTGALLATLAGHTSVVVGARFSPDGSRVVTASGDLTARLWDVATGKLIAVLQGHDDWLGTPSFSPDGQRVLTMSLDGSALIWDAHLEARGLEEITAIVEARVPWLVVGGALQPRALDGAP